MLKPIVIGIALILGGTPAFAQEPSARNCLHGPNESASNRTRRQQALQYVARVNMAETGPIIAPGQLPLKYRPLEELSNLLPLPPGFDVHFHTDVRTYTLSLKDTRDPCHYAIFSDQDRLLYEATPSRGEATIVPAGTK